MEVIGFIILAAILVVVIVAAISIFGSFGGTGRGNSRPSDPISFSMKPKVICQKAECSVEIDYTVETSEPNALVSFSVLTPQNRTSVISNALSLRRTIAGNDPFWSDGAGHYVFTWRASNLQQGSITNVHDVHVLGQAGGTILDFISFRFGANDSNRRVATDTAIFGTVAGRKGRSFSTCEKYMSLEAVRYVSGGIAGYPNEISVEIFAGNGNRITGVTLKPNVSGSDTLILNSPIPIANGIAIASSMVSGQGPEFPIGQSISWELEYRFGCM